MLVGIVVTDPVELHRQEAIRWFFQAWQYYLEENIDKQIDALYQHT